MDTPNPVSTAIRRAADACGGQAALAAAVGISGPSPRATVWAWVDRGRVPPEHCAAIELAAGGAVTRRDLRPDDWYRIWPELVTADHPAPVSAQAA